MASYVYANGDAKASILYQQREKITTILESLFSEASQRNSKVPVEPMMENSYSFAAFRLPAFVFVSLKCDRSGSGRFAERTLNEGATTDPW